MADIGMLLPDSTCSAISHSPVTTLLPTLIDVNTLPAAWYIPSTIYTQIIMNKTRIVLRTEDLYLSLNKICIEISQKML